MRPGLVGWALVAASVCAAAAEAQAPGLQLQGGLGYARLFDGGGVSFTAALQQPVSSPTKTLQHALGGTFWYAHTTIGSAPGSSLRRDVVGLGVRYQVGFRPCCRSARAFLAVPVQLLRSNIPDRATLQGANLLLSGIPDVGPPSPVEDRAGSDWGWGAGLELGFSAPLAQQLSALLSAQGLYQDIYASGSRHGAWSLHAGLAYQLGGSN